MWCTLPPNLLKTLILPYMIPSFHEKNFLIPSLLWKHESWDWVDLAHFGFSKQRQFSMIVWQQFYKKLSVYHNDGLSAYLTDFLTDSCTVSWLRPRRRRRFKTFRPPGDAMRLRKPCVRNRLRTLGCQVRLVAICFTPAYTKIMLPLVMPTIRLRRSWVSHSARSINVPQTIIELGLALLKRVLPHKFLSHKFMASTMRIFKVTTV